MKIETFEVHGLWGRERPIKVSFHEDLNIITGRNGSGKTTILKLMWFLISGNTGEAISEIEFDYANLKTDEYDLKIWRVSSHTCHAEIIDRDGETHVIADIFAEEEDGPLIALDAREQLSNFTRDHGSSLFFPTFRRIEGGFSVSKSKRSRFNALRRQDLDLEEAMAGLARKLTNHSHTFVSSISTVDIESFLLKNYTDLSETYARMQQRASEEIIEKIRGYKSDSIKEMSNSYAQASSANEVINDVQKTIEEMEDARIRIMAPMTAVQRVVAGIFQHSGIMFGTRLSFGDAAEAINSDALSAGEKQMLSFICYNAFKKDCVSFIDEPELSLHVDWQRSLFPTLLEQRSNNQFVIATHSPFIYSKYPDKEVCIDEDLSRGDEEH